ncbi:type II toxin-antitoxin system antitoxin SocA domain-containing protein [Spiroplasma tabanidicola]|uniref:type II toxin-antitoxin system antitoxin SocA domain-containing protein n=1 Tax=Spiroplasma tabanidicola TaxID=324079 RepID=UPI0012DCEE7A
MKNLIFFVSFILFIYKKELFEDDFVAYKFGPVIEILYNEIKKYNLNKNENLPKDLFQNTLNLENHIDVQLIKNLLDILFKISTWRLVKLIHIEDSPWGATEQSKVIDKVFLKEYFSNVELR